MLALPLPEVGALLQSLFRARGALKVGYGLAGDLAAVAQRLGGGGGACVAVVSPALDVGSVQRALYRRRVAGVLQVDSHPKP